MNTLTTRLVGDSSSNSPPIDSVQAFWAVRELDLMIDQLGSDSPVALVLQHARREILSLMSSRAGQVVGPYRVAA